MFASKKGKANLPRGSTSKQKIDSGTTKKSLTKSNGLLTLEPP